jgi:hypothetical protein
LRATVLPNLKVGLGQAHHWLPVLIDDCDVDYDQVRRGAELRLLATDRKEEEADRCRNAQASADR